MRNLESSNSKSDLLLHLNQGRTSLYPILTVFLLPVKLRHVPASQLEHRIQKTQNYTTASLAMLKIELPPSLQLKVLRHCQHNFSLTLLYCEALCTFNKSFGRVFFNDKLTIKCFFQFFPGICSRSIINVRQGNLT